MSTPQPQQNELFVGTEPAPLGKTYYVFKNVKTGARRRVAV